MCVGWQGLVRGVVSVSRASPRCNGGVCASEQSGLSWGHVGGGGVGGVWVGYVQLPQER